MANILDKIERANSIAIAGHVRPDGDCIGSCLGLYNYVKNIFPEKEIDVYLEVAPERFHYIKNIDKVNTSFEKNMVYDLFVSLDCGDLERLGEARKYFEQAKETINIDHHISNTNFADTNIVKVNASSTCETLYDLLEETNIDEAVAECLYTGLVHDTGVFKHSNTSKHTMEIAGNLIGKGIAFSRIIEESFYQKTFMQNQLLGRCLTESKLLLDGKIIVCAMTSDIMNLFGASAKDIDGVIDQLRVTKGVEVAILIHETMPQTYKVSMRANNKVDVSKIAVIYGGGGHIKAAGCTMTGTVQEVIDQLTKLIEEQLRELA